MQLPVLVRRAEYRLGYRALRILWFFTHPRLHGAKCAITDGDRVLLVRHTYGARVWDFPGGKVEDGEDPREAAAREMAEELGLVDVDWQPTGVLTETVDYRHDTIHCFTAELHEPQLRLQRAELERAQWFHRAAVPPDLAPHAREIIAMLRPLGA